MRWRDDVDYITAELISIDTVYTYMQFIWTEPLRQVTYKSSFILKLQYNFILIYENRLSFTAVCVSKYKKIKCILSNMLK